MAFQNQIIELSQQSRADYLMQQNITFRTKLWQWQERSAETTPQLHKEFEDVFNGMGCFSGTFLLQLKPDSKPYQASLRCMAYALQKPFKEELERLKNKT